MNQPHESMNGAAHRGKSGEWTRSAEAIMHLLTRWVRVVADDQLRGLGRRRSRELLRQLQSVDLVSLRTVLVPPELPLEAPIVVWSPGAPPPQFDRVAWRLAARWQQLSRKVIVASATKHARIATGSPLGGRPLRRTEITHDLHVTALYLKFVREDPERATRWIHEDAMPRERLSGELIPDALIGETAIEFGGQYRAAKLRAIHRGHAMAGRPYEIW